MLPQQLRPHPVRHHIVLYCTVPAEQNFTVVQSGHRIGSRVLIIAQMNHSAGRGSNGRVLRGLSDEHQSAQLGVAVLVKSNTGHIGVQTDLVTRPAEDTKHANNSRVELS